MPYFYQTMSIMLFRCPVGQLLFTSIIGLLLLITLGFAQIPLKQDSTVYTVVEYQPEFPGNRSGLRTYLQKTVQYPAEAQKAGIKGRVFVSFIVEPDGSLSDVQVMRGLDYGCDEEAVRVIKAMPRWKPGNQSGILGLVNLRVRYNLPIFFNIDYTYYPRLTKY